MEEARAHLRALLPVGTTVTCVLRSVARSGMSRRIDFYKLGADGSHDWLTSRIARALGDGGEVDKGLRVSGCGMDMGFHVVHELAARLYPDGFGCIGDTPGGARCPSNDHMNGDRDYTPNGEKQVGWAACDACCDLSEEQRDRNQGCPDHAHWHKSGGYALRHKWL